MSTKWILCVVLVGTCACSQPKPLSEPQEVTAKQSKVSDETVALTIVGFNDLHGHLEAPAGSVRIDGQKVPAGGATYLAAQIDAIRKEQSHVAVVTAGDMIGASPLLSALFHDEPTIEALTAMKIDASAVGNHEFDEGVEELLRMQTGGCHKEDGCQDGDPFEGAGFPFLAANVTYKKSGETIFPTHIIREYDGVRVGFIGLTLEGTPAIVDPTGIADVEFHDEIRTINRVVANLVKDGINAIIVMIHEGGAPTVGASGINDCPNISGPIIEIVEGIDLAVDAVITGHTHQAYICQIGNRLVTSAKSYGRLLTRIDAVLSRSTGDFITMGAHNILVAPDGETTKAIDVLIEKYDAIVKPLANARIGTISGPFSREPNDDGESPLGKLIADIQLAATNSPEKGGAQIAWMNPGGIRADLAGASDGVVTYKDAQQVQPFGNSLVTMTLTGDQVKAVLQQQFENSERPKILQTSAGFTYRWSRVDGPEQSVMLTDLALHGTTIGEKEVYRVTVNSFLANGGDGFTTLLEGTDRLGGPVDLEALVTFFQKSETIGLRTDQRIEQVQSAPVD
jgi:5'-nucleotidase